MPSWWKAVTTAENLLAVSDPGYRYHAPQNVQSSRARLDIANRVGMYTILSRVAAPIQTFPSKCEFPWLLHGSAQEQRKVIGCTGFCSELMHIFAQITHLSGCYLKVSMTFRVGQIFEQTNYYGVASRLDHHTNSWPRS